MQSFWDKVKITEDGHGLWQGQVIGRRQVKYGE